MSRAYLVAGLGFGDEGKGTITQYLASRHDSELVVRYNGGCQAAHNVYSKDGQHHTFAQFGSATLEGKRTHLSRFMMVEPHALFAEGRHLISLGIPDPYKLLTIDEQALLVTPYHRSANRIREIKRGADRHGTCGVGIGETMQYFLKNQELAPKMVDLRSPEELRKKLVLLRDLYQEEFKREYFDISIPDAGHHALRRLFGPVEHIVDKYAGILDILQLVGPDYLRNTMETSNRPVIFEGAQGVLLDQDYGFHPHTTWSHTTFDNAQLLLSEAGIDPDNTERVGVTRTYMTRHGDGPMPTEIDVDKVLDHHNRTDLWQGRLRAGYLDLMLLNYAVRAIGGVDTLALTHCDQLQDFDRFCTAYRIENEEDYKLFDAGDSRIGGRIKLPSGIDGQSAITKMLSRVKPVYMAWSSSVRRIAETLETDLGANVSIFSHGPGPGDKQLSAPEEY